MFGTMVSKQNGEQNMDISHVLLERWGYPFGYEERSVCISDDASFQEFMHSLQQEPSAIVAIMRPPPSDDPPTLYIYFSNGQCSVSLQETEHRSLDLVGDDYTQGAIDFISGGQLVSIPQRYIASFDTALKVALVFMHTMDSVLPGKWDVYGPNSAWDQV